MSIPRLTMMEILSNTYLYSSNYCHKDPVYHYTDLNAFINIFSNRELWISNHYPQLKSRVNVCRVRGVSPDRWRAKPATL